MTDKPLREMIRDYAIIAWIVVQITLQFWTLAQQSLIATSQAQQQAQQAMQRAQQAEQELRNEKAKRAGDTKAP